MTHYSSPKPDELIPPSPGHHNEWLIGCKTGKPTLCNFDYSGALIEHNLLAFVSFRLGEVRDVKTRDKTEKITVGRKLLWDAGNIKATNCPEANQYIRKTYRKGWILNG